MNNLARIETYSYAVFAIAATLLVLEIRVPPVGLHAPLRELWHALADLWPSYLAFALSFAIILIAWVNHHHGIRMLSKMSTAFLYANGLLLLAVTFISISHGIACQVCRDRTRTCGRWVLRGF